MTTLEEQFVAAIDRLEVPDVDLSGSVVARLAEAGTDRRATGARWWWAGRKTKRAAERGARPRVAWVPLAVVLVVAVLTVITFTPARRAVADWLGIGATTVQLDDRTDTEVPGQQPPAEPGPGRSADELGRPVPVDRYDPIPAIGPPDGVFDHPGRGRSFTWSASGDQRALPGSATAVVLSVRPVSGSGLAVKSVAGDVGVELVTVADGDHDVPALWIDGTHELVAAGTEAPVLAERVLLWELDGIEYRLESAEGLDHVRSLAAEVRGTDLLPPG